MLSVASERALSGMAGARGGMAEAPLLLVAGLRTTEYTGPRLMDGLRTTEYKGRDITLGKSEASFADCGVW